MLFTAFTDHHQPEGTCSALQSYYLLFLPNKKRKCQNHLIVQTKEKNVGVKISKRQKQRDRAGNKTGGRVCMREKLCV